MTRRPSGNSCADYQLLHMINRRIIIETECIITLRPSKKKKEKTLRVSPRQNKLIYKNQLLSH